MSDNPIVNHDHPLVKKPLATQDEIDAAYPEHRRLHSVWADFETIDQALENLENMDIRLCRKHEGAVDNYYYPLSGFGIERQKLVYKVLGIDYDVIMREKDDMVKQLQMRWQDGNRA